MTVFSLCDAQKNLVSVLDRAKAEGKVFIKRRDGSMFSVQPVAKKGSPLDVEGVDVGIQAAEIVEIVREMRER